MFTATHFHLLVNHFPIVGVFFALLVISWAQMSKNIEVKKLALFVLVLIGAFSILSSVTGDKAEHDVEKMPLISKNMIHEHEEVAEKANILAIVTAALAIANLVMIVRKGQAHNALWLVTIGLTYILAVLMVLAGSFGGKIRRPDLRGESFFSSSDKAPADMLPIKSE